MNVQEKQLVTLRDLATERHVTITTVRRWAREGIKGIRLRTQFGNDFTTRVADRADVAEFFRLVAKRKGMLK